jgi:hypothetical protein
LGFYVSQIVRRWWDQYKLLPWPDTLVLLSHGLVNYEAEKSVEFFRTIMRYTMLSYILCLRRLSKVKMCASLMKVSFNNSNSGLEKDVSIKPVIDRCQSCNQKGVESHGEPRRPWKNLVDAYFMVNDYDQKVRNLQF